MTIKKCFFVILILLMQGSACSREPKEKQSKGENPMIIELPKPEVKGKMSLEECLLNRRSTRYFTDIPLTIGEISQMLWAAYGITKTVSDAPAFLRGGLRTAPSAGALYPLEIYVLAANVEGINAGIYHYDSEKHTLKLLKSGDKRIELGNASLRQKQIELAPATFIYSAIYERTTGKYGQRGKERYVCMDLGHSAQNLCLQAVALGIGICTIGAFNDDDVKKLIGLRTDEEVMYILPVGR